MVVLNHLLLNPTFKILAFCGGKGRSYLIRQIAEEIVDSGATVTITGVDSLKLPLSGTVVIGENLPVLVEQIRTKMKESPVIYIGKMLEDNLVQGFSLSELKELTQEIPTHYLLVELGLAAERPLCNPAAARKWVKRGAWDQLIYCLEITQLDQPLSRSNADNLPLIRKYYPGAKSLSSDFLKQFLSDKKHGLGMLFDNPWPTLFLLTDVEFLANENRAISLARELKSAGIQHVALANLENNLIKKIDLG